MFAVSHSQWNDSWTSTVCLAWVEGRLGEDFNCIKTSCENICLHENVCSPKLRC